MASQYGPGHFDAILLDSVVQTSHEANGGTSLLEFVWIRRCCLQYVGTITVVTFQKIKWQYFQLD